MIQIQWAPTCPACCLKPLIGFLQLEETFADISRRRNCVVHGCCYMGTSVFWNPTRKKPHCVTPSCSSKKVQL